MKKFELDKRMKSFLKDFNSFIEYLAFNEVTVGKTNNFISPKFLFEINEVMEIKQEGIKPTSTQVAYPLIHLFHNLSVSGRLFVRKSINGGKIILKATDRLKLFNDLSEVEKYITLIEILWVDCDFEKIRYQTHDFIDVNYTMRIVENLSVSPVNQNMHVDKNLIPLSTIILYLSYFGLIDVKENELEGKEKNERVFLLGEIKVITMGLEILKILDQRRNIENWNLPYLRELGEWNVEFIEEFYVPFKKLFKDGELNKTLPRKAVELKNGIYTFKVSLNKNMWAKIRFNGNHTLLDLHNYIQEAFSLDNDNMYSFFMDGVAWSKNKFTSPYDDEGPHVDEAKIGELGLDEKQSFLYLFNYSNPWRFEVEVDDIEETELRLLRPQIVEAKGN
ncbi:plasmid pRiA4b ORF-3 family protein [Inconstantimicrobium mannanitabidum]|uniref:Uncharacterized protein n=1 Tax=Inconstantimicrobium mannanitabidum TaxID=1604901 RepID=A0ACB5R9Q4_9CLOT|nr:plasmid pRiA4b ORF-3 family protein [Clostridium sp. TW13]GKX65917.1 hypothetical protein rsdtw13_11750 [Clostridium sp. TW13]